MIFVNFKTYPNGTGEKAVSLARICKDVSGTVKVIPVVQIADVYRVKRALGGVEVWTQHVDGVGYGQSTGWVLPEAAKEAGVTGTFLNHSEHRIYRVSEEERVSEVPASLTGGPKVSEELRETVERCRGVGLKTLVFVADLSELDSVIELKPDFVAYEPPALIGSREHSVAEQPEIVAEASEMARKVGIPLLAGAGIHSTQDVRASLVSRAVGVVVARSVLEADDPKTELLKLIEGFTHPGVEMAGGK